MSDFMDDVEPAADHGSRSGTPLGARFNLPDQQQSGPSDKRRQLSPEPDEDLDLSEGKINTWLVKAPKFLIEAWSHVKEKDQQLGVVRVYNPDANGHQRMELILHGQDGKQGFPIPIPPGVDLPRHLVNIPRRYDLRMHSNSTGPRNMYSFKESALDNDSSSDEDEDDEEEDGGNSSDAKGKGKRKGAWAVKSAKKGKRTPALVGTITSELSAAPQIAAPGAASSSASAAPPKLTDEYREILRRRKLEASQPKRTVKMLDAEDLGKRNMLAAGVGLGYSKAKTGTLIAPKAKASATEKFARMPRNELLDLLFAAFERYPYWSLRGMREHTQQPEAYLREVLSDIADLHRKGPYNGNWSLKPSYANARQAQADVEAQQAQAQAAAQSQQASRSGSAPVTQQTDDDDDDEPDDEDLEEVEV